MNANKSAEKSGEVAVLEQKIEKAEKMQEIMKKTNSIIRRKISDGNKFEEMLILGLSESKAKELLNGDFMGRKGFAPYQLTNNSANIRRMKKRIPELGRREEQFCGEEVEKYKDVEMVDNRDIDRIQILFDEKPSYVAITDLKRSGWHWSPSNGAWQRKTTNSAVYSAKSILDKHYEKIVEEN